MIVDGGVRLIGYVGLALAGSDNPTAYALALRVGPLVAVLLCVRWATLTGESGRTPATPPSWTAITAGVGWLVCASALSMHLAKCSSRRSEFQPNVVGIDIMELLTVSAVLFMAIALCQLA